MVYLQYQTRHGQLPQGKARVYFCSHEKDQEIWLPQISSKLLELNDCAVYYAEPSVPRNGEFLENLKDMNLFVIPVTQRLLTTENDALEREFVYAKKQRIPILPILMEPDLLWLYSEKFGDLQFLDPNEQDATALSYQEKLAKFLNQTLLNDDLIQKVRAAFDAYVFLSYRKQDRAFAQQLMRLIHKNDFCRDIAIWYDEFLTPGEDFNQSIRKALEDSELFVMAVTPRIVEPGANSAEDNYIVQKEYPMAKKAGKRILPVEMEKTDKEKLKKKFTDLPNSTNGNDPKALAAAMKNALQNIALRNPEKSPAHDFFIGLAYLKGIDVEVDYKKAVKLIESAANAEVLPALEMMTQLYGAGTGVERSVEKMLLWQQKLVAKRTERYERDPSLQNGLDLLMDLQALQGLYGDLGNSQAQVETVCRQQTTAETVRENTPDPEAERYWAAAVCVRSQLLWSAGKAAEAKALCSEAEQILRQALEKTGIRLTNSGFSGTSQPNVLQTILLRDYCTILCTLADADLSLYEQTEKVGYIVEAEAYFNRCQQYLTGAALKDRYPYNWEQRSVIAQRMGDLAKAKGQTAEAKKWYKESVNMDVERVKIAAQDKDFDAFESLAKSLVTLTWADPEDADVLSLMDAVEIWECLAFLVPEFPAYKEYYEELKPLLDQMLSNRKDDKVFRYKKQLHPFQSPVYAVVAQLKGVVQRVKQKQEEQRAACQCFSMTMIEADAYKAPAAQYETANSAYRGIGTRVNIDLALYYGLLAAEQGHQEAEELLKTILSEPIPPEAEENARKVRRFFKERAEEEKRLAVQAEKERQAEQAQERKKQAEEEAKRKALEGKKKRAEEKMDAALAGDLAACWDLIEYYHENHKDAEYLRWLRVAGSFDDVKAWETMGDYYRLRDRRRAKERYKKAVKLGSLTACKEIRTLYLQDTLIDNICYWYWDKKYQRMEKAQQKAEKKQDKTKNKPKKAKGKQRKKK